MKSRVFKQFWATIRELRANNVEVTSEMHSAVLKQAWQRIKEEIDKEAIENRDQTIVSIITPESLKAILETSKTEVKFGFYKKDGSVRIVHGTLNFKAFPEAESCLVGRGRNSTNLAFFDLSINEWRSMAGNTTEAFLFKDRKRKQNKKKKVA